MVRLVFAIIGFLLVAWLIGIAIAFLMKNVWVRDTTDRYRVKERLLPDGRVITEIIDIEKDEIEIERKG